MSEPRRIGYVTEGITDYLVMDAIIERFLGSGDYVPVPVQPPVSEYAGNLGPLGGGWKGVLKWWADQGSAHTSFASSAVLANFDILTIHVDADIAAENDLADQDLVRPCPPAAATCNLIRAYLIYLLGGGPLPDKVVFCVPAQCTEAWVFAALHSGEVERYDPIECRPDVDRLLIGRPDRLVRDKDGAAKKQPDRYKSSAPRIAAQWDHAAAACIQAKRFEDEFRAIIP